MTRTGELTVGQRAVRLFGRIVLRIALFIVLSVGGLVVWYKLTYPTYTHRYRLALAIEMGGQTYSGSSVVEVFWIGQPKFGGASPFISVVKGQAALVSLPNGAGLVGALHTTPDIREAINTDVLALRAFHLTGFEAYRQIGRETSERNLSPDNMPLLIWFSRIDDPTTARPIMTLAEIAEVLGKDAAISAKIEMTRAPIVVDIEQKLPWVKSLIPKKDELIITHPGKFKLVHNMFVGDINAAHAGQNYVGSGADYRR